MAALILTQREIRELLPMDACIELVAEALAALARGAAQNPLRRGLRLSDGQSLLGTMPGELSEPRAIGLKAITVFPGNHGGRWDAHQGVVVLFDAENGEPTAILQASEITAIRTAAASGVATRALAREDAHDLALIGAGVQARAHLAAMLAVRRIERVRVFCRNAEQRQAFARREAQRHGIAVAPAESARAAVEGADIVCTTTSAREPVLFGEWLASGTHVNAVGACVPKARELDTAAVARSRLFVDRRESALAESGDFLLARAEGAIGDDHIVAELGEVLIGSQPGRRNRDEITLFDSLGLAVEDLAAADYVVRRARERGLGTEIDLGGEARA